MMASEKVPKVPKVAVRFRHVNYNPKLQEFAIVRALLVH